MRRAWGRNILHKRIEDKSVSSDILEYFENLMMSIVARIVEDTSTN